jgi:YegS/Rv2252/BmrU family lipid kinase
VTYAAVIINPRAGGARARRVGPAERAALAERIGRRAGLLVRAVVTEARGHGVELARQALADGASLVVAWGGDGTVNEVASALAGSPVPLGIVPAGSGNGLARELGLSRNPEAALAAAFSANERRIDAGVLGGRVFVNVGGIGFDARIAARFDAAGGRRGLFEYVRLTVRELWRYRPARYRIEHDGGQYRGAALIVAAANSRQYGNGAWIAPRARLDDGRLDLVIVESASPLGNLWRARRLFDRSLLEDRGVQTAQVTRVRVEADEPVELHVDGEPAGTAREVVVEVRPGALRVRTGTPPTSRSPGGSRP